MLGFNIRSCGGTVTPNPWCSACKMKLVMQGYLSASVTAQYTNWFVATVLNIAFNFVLE